ncbi:MAG: DnaJ domain-containing protein [Cyanobacteriota bacterium]|nr:DnaJ domain-containing protein [Cyanobacteriota bacterium]
MAPPSPADPYAVLGVSPAATAAEIKAAYRSLVKRHHPDAGGDETRIVALNAAWEVLRDGERRRRYDVEHQQGPHAAGSGVGARHGGGAKPQASASRHSDGLLLEWLQQIYTPIDRWLGQVINPFAAQLRALAADPYDDQLMDTFCGFLRESQARMARAEQLYRSKACPAAAKGFSLSLYHCLSQVQDALAELERYTLGYVDDYLRDGREMLREAKKRRERLHQERRRLDL